MNEITNIETGEITPITEMPAVAGGFSSASLVLSDDAMRSVVRIADLMASGRTTIPKHLQGSQGDCFAVSLQAMQWGMNPFSVAQKTHLVNGTLGYEAQLIIAVLNSSPALASRLNFQWSENWNGINGKTDKSQDHWCCVWATLNGEADPRALTVSMAQVGDNRNSPNWVSDPRQQLAYLAAKRWARLHAPDVILGVYTPDELQDAAPLMQNNAPRLSPAEIGAASLPKPAERDTRLDNLIADLELVAKEGGPEPLADAWGRLTKEDRKAIGQDELKRLKAIAEPDTTTESQEPNHD